MNTKLRTNPKTPPAANRVNRIPKNFRPTNGSGKGAKPVTVTNHTPSTPTLDALPEALKKKIAQIQPAVAALSDANIRKRWEIGRELREIDEDATGQYGSDPVKAMQKVMPLSRDGLRPMLEMARRYEEEDISRLVGLRHPTTGESLNYSHVMALTRVKDKAKVFKLAEQAVTKGLTSKELNREIISIKGGPQSKGGRKPTKQTTFPAAAADMLAKLTTLENAIDQVWMAPGVGLPDLYQTMASAPGWKPDPATTEVLDRIVDKVMSVNHKFSGLAQVMSNVKHRNTAAKKVSEAA